MTAEFDLDNEKFDTININDPTNKAINKLENNVYETIFVTDSKNHLLGALTPNSILKMGNKSTNVKKLLIKLPLIQKFNINQLAQTFVEKNTLLLPMVSQNETILHVTSIFSVARNILTGIEFEKSEITNEKLFHVDLNDNIETLLNITKREESNFIPVLDNTKLIGFIRNSTLLSLIDESDRESRGDKKGEKSKYERNIQNLTEDINITLGVTEYYEAQDLIAKMEKSKSNHLFLTDNENKLIGFISLKQLIRFVNEPNDQLQNNIQISVLSAPDNNIETIAKKKILALIERHIKFIGADSEAGSTVKFHKIESQSQRGMFKYETNIRISFGKGKDSIFTVETSDWGSEKSLNKAFNKISRLISDKRKMAKDSYQKKNI